MRTQKRFFVNEYGLTAGKVRNLVRGHKDKSDVWVRGRFREETSGGVSRCRQGFLRLGCNRSWKVLRSTEKDIFTNCKFKLTMMGSHTF